jgi:hypothetical protein
MIRLQFSRQADLGSTFIAWFGHGAGYSHVDTVLGDGQLLGARADHCAGVPPGVQVRPPDYAAFSRTLVVELPASAETTSVYYAFVRGQVGKGYDMTAIVGFAAGRDWRAPDSWFCSELAAAALEASSFFAFPLATPANKISPDDLLLVCSTRVRV